MLKMRPCASKAVLTLALAAAANMVETKLGSRALASVTRISVSEPEAYEAAVRSAHPRGLVTLERGIFQASLTQVTTDRLRLQLGEESLSRSAYVEIPADRCPIVFLADEEMPPIIHDGVELLQDELLFNSPGSKSFHRTLGTHRWGGMSLATDDLEKTSAALSGRAIRPPTTSQHIKMFPDALGRLRSLHSRAMSLAKTTPQIFDHPEVGKAIEQSLIVTMIDCLIRGDFPDPRTGLRRSRIIMRQFEEWLEANLDRPVYLAEICAVLGVPARTLKYYCHEHLGMGPTQYLRLRRMRMARQTLLEAGGTTVSEIAAKYGFWELGRFAVAYRILFGESPSATLAKSRFH
jgi:AraC-like DNA-binding protein